MSSFIRHESECTLFERPTSLECEATMAEGLKTNDIGQRIYLIRGCQVMMDSELAELYEVAPRTLNQAVRRNMKPLPKRFHVSDH
jgi:hypothetical protein